MAERAEHACEYCALREEFSASSFCIEHIIPRAAGGPTRLDNLAFACGGCNGHKSDKLWKISEWEFFLDDLAANHLLPGAQVCLELNREYDDSLYTPELKAYFESRGADIHTQRVHFNPLRPAPSAVAPTPP